MSMSRSVVFISDFFVEQVLGGGELNDSELIKMLQQKNTDVTKIQSHMVDQEFLESKKDNFFLISNFANLNQDSKEWLMKNADYVIYEHDHKYLSSRNPAFYKSFKAPASEIRNYAFYKTAVQVICQSSFHCNIIKKNLEIDNITNISGNLWSVDVLNKMRQLNKKQKNNKCSILRSGTAHKNTVGAVNYCKEKQLDYDLISNNDYVAFLNQLSENDTFVFIPKTPETLSRVVVEARMMGMSVRTNGLVGASAEPWFNLKGGDLIDYMINKRDDILDKVVGFINTTRDKKRKKISIISTFHDGSEFLEGFLENMVEQTIFNDCELIIIDSASKNNEKQLINDYMSRYDNIHYHRIEELLHPTPCLNMAIRQSSAEYITFGLIDDRKSKDCLEALLDAISEEKVDLVYGDTAQTAVKNEKFETNNLKRLFEHSRYGFSKENMVKCLPGPMPLWRRKIHEKCGFFDENNLNYADDWEMWLRSVADGSTFKKVDKVVGLYLEGGRSQQNNIEQRKEEARIFFRYSHLFGKNYEVYRSYFSQFV